mmetsp:Transcript_108059/g.328446  ORF Transcript_108059/g.328446 Transcript_108059/m.328446 type:complete len:249 (-) Transcript_108059:86-832(-)
MAAAMACAPASPMRLSRSESLRIVEPAPSTAAIALAPASPMPLPPRQSSPMAGCCGFANAQATARAPLSRSPTPLSSSSGWRGGARRHSRQRTAEQTAHMRARSANAGSQSMKLCRSSPGISGSLSPICAGAAAVTQGASGAVAAGRGGDQPTGYWMTQVVRIVGVNGPLSCCLGLILGLAASLYHVQLCCGMLPAGRVLCGVSTEQLPAPCGQPFWGPQAGKGVQPGKRPPFGAICGRLLLGMAPVT